MGLDETQLGLGGIIVVVLMREIVKMLVGLKTDKQPHETRMSQESKDFFDAHYDALKDIAKGTRSKLDTIDDKVVAIHLDVVRRRQNGS
jgi:hypothetical protein